MISTAIIASLLATRGEGDQRFAELLAVLGYCMPFVQRGLRHAMARAAGLDAGRFRRSASVCLKPCPSLPPSQVLALDAC